MLKHKQRKQKMKNALQNLFRSNSMAFEAVVDDGDDLIEGIREGRSAYDDAWDLHEEVDGESLEKFWDEATKELIPEQAGE